MESKIFIVEEKDANVRIDKAISDKDSSLSRVAIQRLIESIGKCWSVEKLQNRRC